MNKKVIEDLAKVLKLDVKVLTEAIETEGKVIELPEGSRFLTKEEVDTIKDNHGKTRYDAGKIAGSEMLLKDLSEKVGFGESVKDGETFISKYKSSVLEEAKVEPNKKIVELEKSVENLRDKLTEKDTAYESLQKSINGERQMLKAQSFVPELPESLGLSKAEAVNLILSGIDIKEDGLYKGDTILKDSMEKPLTLENYVKESISSRGWSTKPAGRGGGSGGAGGSGGTTGLPKTMAEYEAHIKEKGFHPGSEQAQSLLREAAKETPELLGATQ